MAWTFARDPELTILIQRMHSLAGTSDMHSTSQLTCRGRTKLLTRFKNSSPALCLLLAGSYTTCESATAELALEVAAPELSMSL